MLIRNNLHLTYCTNIHAADGWEAVGISLKYGDLMAWPVVLLKRPRE